VAKAVGFPCGQAHAVVVSIDEKSKIQALNPS